MAENKSELSQTLAQTLEYMKTTSRFAYRENMDYRLTRRSRFKNFDEIEKEILVGEHIAGSDYFILKAVADFSFSNMEMIQLEIRKMKQKDSYGELVIPSSGEETIQNSLLRLCGQGLVREFEYKNSDNRTVRIYCATDGGIELIKKKLYYNTQHKEILTSLNSPEEVMRRLAGNYVGQKMSLLDQAEKYIAGKYEYVKNYGKSFVYSRIFLTSGEKKYHFVVEPLYFIVNRKLCDEETLRDNMKERLRMISKLLENYKETHENKVIFVVENSEGLTKAIQLVLHDFPYLLQDLDNVSKATGNMNDIDQNKLPFLKNMYFTSENAVYRNKYMNRAMLQLESFSGDKIRVSTVKKLF